MIHLPKHPIREFLPHLKAVLFIPHIMWEPKRNCPSADPDQIFGLLDLKDLAETIGISLNQLWGAQMYTSITGPTVSTAFFFSRKAEMMETLRGARFSLNLNDGFMTGSHEELTQQAELHGKYFMKYDLEGLSAQTECLIVFTHIEQCDYFPKVLFQCTNGLTHLDQEESVQTRTETLRWVNLTKMETGVVKVMS